jgi:hypothetical protein
MRRIGPIRLDPSQLLNKQYYLLVSKKAGSRGHIQITKTRYLTLPWEIEQMLTNDYGFDFRRNGPGAVDVHVSLILTNTDSVEVVYSFRRETRESWDNGDNGHNGREDRED